MLLSSLWARPASRLVGVAFFLAVLLVLDQHARPVAPGPAQAVVPLITAHGAPVQAASLQRVAMGAVPMPAGTTAAHASSLLPMPKDSASALSLFWFSGEREGGPMVQIAASQWDRASQAWLPARFVVNRHVMGHALGYSVRRLGNPVAWRDAQGRIHLFVVATGMGGWAASRILHVQQSSASQDLADLTFEPVRVLPLSWLWNTSFLVRNAPLALQDGGAVLPVHFELGLKHPEVVRLDDQGHFLGLTRLSNRPYLLQPSLVPTSPTHWVALMREERENGKIGAVATDDAGAHWTDLPDLPLGNPDSALAGFVLGPQQMVLAHNLTPDSRSKLFLSHGADPLHWIQQTTLAQGGPETEYSYPAMAWADGNLWISYTVDRTSLSWQRFSPGGQP